MYSKVISMPSSVIPPVHWKVKTYSGDVRIGEVAVRGGVSVKTLRYYEQIGVVGAPDRTPSGYRDYPEAVLERLEFVRAAQAVGLTLAEIRDIVRLRAHGEPPCAHVLDLIERHTEGITRHIRELERVRDALGSLAERGRTLDPRDCDPLRVCHVISRR
jgi:DNA-binding transcriptional MerR regulator